MSARRSTPQTPTSAAGLRRRSTAGDVLLDVRDLSVVYESAGQTAVQAVDHVSFSLRKGEFVGLVGESGSGKSTLGYALTRLQKPPARTNGGSIVFDGARHPRPRRRGSSGSSARAASRWCCSRA